MTISKQAVISAVLLVVLFVIAGYISANNKTSTSPIIFDHYLHVTDQGMACTDCHAEIGNKAKGTRLRPDHETCGTCHEQVEDTDRCALCHRDPENPVATPPRTGLYEGFAHASHGSNDCAECHKAISPSLRNPVLPSMDDCQVCHEQKKSAPLECKSCHEGKRPVPTDHQSRFWNQDHGMEALLASSNCRSCHDKGSCDDCHQGHSVNGMSKSPHPPNWMFSHFAEADFSNQCLVCHESRNSCTQCHRRMIPVPHKFGLTYANRQNGGLHKDEFRLFTETCLACHDEGKESNTCMKCHGKD